VAAVQMQGIVLLSTSVITVPVLVATVALLGPGAAAGLILANGLVAGVLGTSILAVRERAKLGRLLGGSIKRLEGFGLAFDAVVGAARGDLARSLAWESVGRVAQVVQCGVALAAIGQQAGLGRVLVTRGALILGSAVGDFIPGQLGATEAMMVVGAEALALTAATAATLALLIHAAQIALGLLCAGLTVALPGRRGILLPCSCAQRQSLRCTAGPGGSPRAASSPRCSNARRTSVRAARSRLDTAWSGSSKAGGRLC
jgi:hypothetical protein